MTRGLVEGALLAALTVVLSLITAYVPFVQLFSAVMVPAPTVVLAVRHGPRLALLSTVAAGLILFTILGPVGAVLGWLHVAGIGVPLGTGIRRGWPAAWTVGVTTVAFLLLALAGVGAALLVSGINPITASLEAYRAVGATTYDLYGRLGLVPDDPGVRDEFVATWNELLDAALTLLPVGLLFAYTGFSLLTYSLNKAVLARLGRHDVPALPPFAGWQAPPWTVYAFAAAAGLYLVHGELGIEAAGPVLYNVLTGFMFGFSILGAAAAYAFLRSWRLGRGVATIILVMLFLSRLAVVLAWLGLLDAGLRLRERFLRRDGGEGEAG